LTANYFNPNGISLTRTNKEIQWASDSLFNISKEDSLLQTETANIEPDSNKTKIEKEEVLESSQSEKVLKTENLKENEEKIAEHEVIPFDEPKNITLEQAYTLFTDGVTFIDARDEAEYLAGYISGSINIPYYDLENHSYKVQRLAKDKPMVIYCAGTDCDLSILLANQLNKDGYKQIYIFFGGWYEWLTANYPTENPEK
jgi:rhodanese-related sulfurtransferase